MQKRLAGEQPATIAYQVAVHGTAERPEQQHRGEVVAIVTLMVGGTVGGRAGAYLALPIAAVIRVVWRRLAASSA